MAKILKIPSAFVIESKVVGVSKNNSDGTSRQTIIRNEVREDDELTLQLEPENPYDPDAICILTKSGHQIGYVAKDIAGQVKSAIINESSVLVKVRWVSGDKYVGVGLRIELVN